jgi:hypothetical protein
MLEPGKEPVAGNVGAPGEPVEQGKALEPIRGPGPRRLPRRLAADRGEVGEPQEPMQGRAPFLADMGLPRRRGRTHGFILEAEFARQQRLAFGFIAGPRLEPQGEVARCPSDEAEMIDRRAVIERAQLLTHRLTRPIAGRPRRASA